MRGGWRAIFNAIVLLQGRSQFATFLRKSIVDVFSQWQSRQRRVPTVDGRSREKHRRALIRDLVRTYIWELPPKSTPRRASDAVSDSSHREQLLTRAVPRPELLLETSAAACERSSLESINRIPSLLDTATLEFTARDRLRGYEESTKPNGAVKVTSARIADRAPAPSLCGQACRLVS